MTTAPAINFDIERKARAITAAVYAGKSVILRNADTGIQLAIFSAKNAKDIRPTLITNSLCNLAAIIRRQTEAGEDACPGFADADDEAEPPPAETPAPAVGVAAPTSHATPGRSTIKATPYKFRDPKDIPPRDWLYGRHLIRRFTSITVAPGGVGKSSLVLAEAVAMATGRDLLKNGHRAGTPLRIWYWNGEDPAIETERRVAALCLHYGIDGGSLHGNLFFDSGRETPIEIAIEDKAGARVAVPVVEQIIAEIVKNKIDVMIIDPFVSSHSINENDNNKIDLVMKRGWGAIAEATNVAIELIHHVRKSAHGQFEHTIDDGRGASALKDASRSARVLNVMSKDEAKIYGLEIERRQYFRSDDGKGNMVRQSDQATWYFLQSVRLNNQTHEQPSDEIAVVARWTPPNPFDGVTAKHLSEIMKRVDKDAWRRDVQAKAWVGNWSQRFWA